MSVAACHSTDKKRPHSNAPKNRVLPCSRLAYVKTNIHQYVSQVARRRGHSRWVGCWGRYRRAGGGGQGRAAPENATSYPRIIREKSH